MDKSGENRETVGPYHERREERKLFTDEDIGEHETTNKYQGIQKMNMVKKGRSTGGAHGHQRGLMLRVAHRRYERAWRKNAESGKATQHSYDKERFFDLTGYDTDYGTHCKDKCKK